MSILSKLAEIAENEEKVYDAGKTEGYNNGYIIGNYEGYNQGKSEGYTEGYEEGYNLGKAEGGDSETLSKLIDGNLTELYIPTGTTTIRDHAFYNCNNLVRVNIPNTVTNIGISAFSGCSSLTSVVIGNSVTNIEGWAFWGCTSLTTITIPNSVISIDYGAFSGCDRISLYDFSSHKSIPTLGSDDVFDTSAPDCQILVPSALYDEWITEPNWITYESYIVAAGVKAAPDESKFNIYVDANTLQEIVNYNVLGIKLGHGIGENYIKNEGDASYLRIHGDGTSNEAFAIVQNVNKQKTGKYLVYAYRIPTSNTYQDLRHFQIYANTTNETPSGEGDMFYVRAYQDGNWHVDIIDIEAAINSSASVVQDNNPSKFTPSNDGEYIAQKLRFDWFNGIIPTSDYIDIAYIALCDSLELARAADPDYTGKEFSLEYFTSKLGSEIKATESGMKYAAVNATTNNNGESWIWLSEDDGLNYRIIPNTTMCVGILYKDAPVRANGNGAWGEIYACSARNSLTNSSWYSLGRIDPYDTSSGWHFGIMKLKAPFADSVCRLMRFDFFNGLNANTDYTMNIAFVKCFVSEEEANAYYQSYKTKYNI